VEIKGPFFFRLGPGIVCTDPGSQDRLTSGAIFNRNLMGFYVNLRYNLGARWISTKIKKPFHTCWFIKRQGWMGKYIKRRGLLLFLLSTCLYTKIRFVFAYVTGAYWGTFYARWKSGSWDGSDVLSAPCLFLGFWPGLRFWRHRTTPSPGPPSENHP